LINKLKDLRYSNWENHPLIVDSLLVSVINEDTLNEITLQMIQIVHESSLQDKLLDPNMVNEIVHVNFAANKFIDFPFIAGWLLGYACIYYNHPSSLSHQQSSISHIELTKYSILATLVSPTLINVNFIDIQEYSIPSLILENEMHKMSWVVDNKLNTLRNVVHNLLDGSILKSIEFKRECFCGSVTL
jgi:hypothetical protein